MIRRIVTVAAFLAVCIAAVVFTGASNDPQGTTFKVELDNAFGLTEGGDLRIGGVKAGTTQSFDITDGEPPKALVTVQISQPGFDSIRTDARCEVKQQSLIGEYYMDCQPGSASEELPAGATIPVEQTASIIPADLVNNVLRRPYAERLRLIIAELGTGLAGRPQDLAETIRRAHPGFRQTSETLGILKDQTNVIRNFITDSDTVVKELAENKADVARFVTEAGETAEISATRREELAEQFEKLPTFLQELEPTMARLGELSDAQIPLLADLRTASSDLDRFFTELGPFAQSARPALRSLGEASLVGDRAFKESRSEIAQLRQFAAKAPRLGEPLRQFLVSFDDRGRAVERDTRAAQTAPPGADPTGNNPQRGFTGMEAFVNYTYWQTLSINGFDEISHFLRIIGIEDEECAPFSVNPEKHVLERCNAFLGPTQPGVENATGELNGNRYPSSQGNFPSGSSGSSASTSKKSSPKPTAAGKRAAGQTPKLPEGIDPEDLVDGGASGSSAQPTDGQTPDQLLDFLLGP